MNVGEAYPHIGIGPDDSILVAVVYEEEEDGSFHAFTPGLPGLHADGITAKEAIQRAKDHVEAYLESMNTHREKLKSCPGLKILKAKPRQPQVRTQWHSIGLSGTSLKMQPLNG